MLLNKLENNFIIPRLLILHSVRSKLYNLNPGLLKFLARHSIPVLPRLLKDIFNS
jgi:hypothetical protein